MGTLLGTIKGVALWYDRLAVRRDARGMYFLRVAPGALQIPDDVGLLVGHNDFMQVRGAALAFDDGDDALRFSATIPDSCDGRTAWSGVRDGTRSGASV